MTQVYYLQLTQLDREALLDVLRAVLSSCDEYPGKPMYRHRCEALLSTLEEARPAPLLDTNLASMTIAQMLSMLATAGGAVFKVSVSDADQPAHFLAAVVHGPEAAEVLAAIQRVEDGWQDAKTDVLKDPNNPTKD